MKILLVEDDLSLINGLSFAIKKQGYELDIARTSLEADEQWADGKYDLVILDVSLPDGSGFDLCKKIRGTSKVPIIFLTAADEETDIIMGLDIGGDDYITKPFKLAVLMSRINALLRRSNLFSQADGELCSGGITVQRLQGKVYKNGEELDLTASEYKLLCFFMENPGIVLSADRRIRVLFYKMALSVEVFTVASVGIVFAGGKYHFGFEAAPEFAAYFILFCALCMALTVIVIFADISGSRIRYWRMPSHRFRSIWRAIRMPESPVTKRGSCTGFFMRSTRSRLF